MANSLKEKVNFNIIRYSNCWEDADVLLKGLAPTAGAKILSIGSAGDNAFALLTSNPELVVAVDLNSTQLHLIELKKTAIAAFDYKTFLAFTGFSASNNRMEFYNSIKNSLSDNARNYWDAHQPEIENGIIYCGKFENYFKLFCRQILPLVHRKKNINNFFIPRTESEQEKFYLRHWNTWRWRLMFRLFFSRAFMGKFGRHPEFFQEVKVNVGKYIFMKSQKHLTSSISQQNEFLFFMYNGYFNPQLLPFYAREKNFVIVKQNIHKLKLVEGFLEDALNVDFCYDYFNLSDIFEYLSVDEFKELTEKLKEKTVKGARFAYWNLMVPRRLSGVNESAFSYQRELSVQLSAVDKGFFYNQFIIDERC